jgi:small subunit ribosomal protein S7
MNHTGRKSAAEFVVYGALDIIREKTKEEPLPLLTRAVENVRPLLEVKARRVGGATYQVPCDVRPLRSATLAMRWILTAARSRKGKPMSEKLAEELMLASRKEGTAFKKREDMHKMAEANRAFAHYKW